MPCTYYLPGEEAAIRSAEYHQQVELLTQLLCTACRSLENTGSNSLRPNGPLGDWWIDHKAKDQKRLEADRKYQIEQNNRKIKERKDKIARLKKELKDLEKE